MRYLSLLYSSLYKYYLQFFSTIPLFYEHFRVQQFGVWILLTLRNSPVFHNHRANKFLIRKASSDKYLS